MTTSDRLRAWRLEQGISQAEVVNRLADIGVEASQAMWSRVETGEIMPSVPLAVGIALLTARTKRPIAVADWVALKKRRSAA